MKKKEEILYEDIFLTFNKEKVNYAVCGGVAVLLYGFPRLTVDLDLIVSLEKENLKKVYELLQKLNYRLKIPIKKEEFIEEKKLKKIMKEKNAKVVSFYNTRDSLKIVDILVNLPNISEILERKKNFRVKNFKIPVVSLEDLIGMKKKLKRKQDLIDIENLKKLL